MSRLIILLVFALINCGNAYADVWTWTDQNGAVHFVTSTTAIYTWLDSAGKAHYSDKPETDKAVRVRLAWHSSGDMAEAPEELGDDEILSAQLDPNETNTEGSARELAKSYYCNLATEVYESYLGAEHLYSTNKQGERQYLSDEDQQIKLAESKITMDQWCD